MEGRANHVGFGTIKKKCPTAAKVVLVLHRSRCENGKVGLLGVVKISGLEQNL